MDKKLKVFLGLFLILVLSGIAYAANDKDTATETTKEQAKNMTYGQCVSEHAVTKNSCYVTVKSALETCKTQAAQDPAKKDVVKQCQKTYKNDKKQCKVVFKASKKECAKIKHNVFETISSALK